MGGVADKYTNWEVVSIAFKTTLCKGSIPATYFLYIVIIMLKDKYKNNLEMGNKKKAKDLLEECYYSVSELPEFNRSERANDIALLCISKQFELLRYLGTKTPDELYNDLVAQKVLLQTFN